MWPFKEKREFKIKGRTIEITNEGEFKNFEFFENLIRSACKYVKVTQKFPKVTFNLAKTKKNGPKGRVNLDELKREKIIVHLFPEQFDGIEKKNLLPNLVKVISHELSHIWHYHVSEIFQKTFETNDRLRKLLDKRLPNLQKYFGLKQIRVFLSIFNSMLLREGLAEYCSYRRLKIRIFDEEIFQYLYHRAERKSKDLEKSFEILLDQEKKRETKKIKRQFIEKIKAYSYDLGVHMVYTIRFTDPDTTIKDIAKMSPSKFAKKYESVIKSKDYHPIFTLTSGDGILDYKDMLKRWWQY